MQFGPDGLLYIGTGDGGGAGDPTGTRRTSARCSGSCSASTRSRATVRDPGREPFVGLPGARPEIFAYGLRNPWRFSFDRATGDLVIGDVGQDRLEEVDPFARPVPGGLDFGWNVYEGSLAFGPGSAPGAVFPVLRVPAHADRVLDHRRGRRPRSGADEARRRYLYGDFCGRRDPLVALGFPSATDDAGHGPQRLLCSSLRRGRRRMRLRRLDRRRGLSPAGQGPAPVPCADVPPQTTITSLPPADGEPGVVRVRLIRSRLEF